jgi:acyl-CoA thioesterase I
MKLLQHAFLVLMVGLLSACGGGSDDEGGVATTPAVVVAFGDSLTANNGSYVTPGVHWVEKLKARISADGINAKVSVTVVNEGRNGETTSQALARLPSVLSAHRPTHIFLAHGTNDIWWECPGCFARAQGNLQQMAELAKAAGAKVIMTDMNFKTNGAAQAQAYTAMFTGAAAATGTTYVDMAAGLPYDLSAYYPDGVHFTDGAQDTLMNNAARALFPLLN